MAKSNYKYLEFSLIPASHIIYHSLGRSGRLGRPCHPPNDELTLCLHLPQSLQIPQSLQAYTTYHITDTLPNPFPNHSPSPFPPFSNSHSSTNLTRLSREFPHLYRWRDESATIFSFPGK